jgi:hypothetical protein
LLGARDHGQLPVLKVDRSPTEGCDLAAAQAAQDAQHQRNEQPAFARGIQGRRSRRRVDRPDRLALDLWSVPLLEESRRVAVDQLPTFGLIE